VAQPTVLLDACVLYPAPLRDLLIVFVCKLIDAALDDVLGATRLHRANIKNPPKSVEEFLTAFETIGLTATVARLRIYADRI
jgi:hypothetical protein